MATLFMLQDRALIRFLVQASQLRKINETLSNIDHQLTYTRMPLKSDLLHNADDWKWGKKKGKKEKKYF